MTSPYLSVVVPAFNEAARIAHTVATVCAQLEAFRWDWELLVVDDGSWDRTAREAEAAGAGSPRVTVHRLPHRGKGAAVKAGLLGAGGAYRFMCDADLSMPLSMLPRFLPPSVHADVVIATREGTGARRIGEPVYRHVTGRVFNAAVRRLLLPGIHDSQCGFKMFTAAAVDAIFPRVSIPGWGVDLEVQSGTDIRVASGGLPDSDTAHDGRDRGAA